MPWHIGEQGSHGCDGFPVLKDSDDSVEGCHDTKAEAEKQMAALYANEKGANVSQTEERITRPPRDNVVRAMPGHFELRAATRNGMPKLVGHFAVIDQWAEIDSVREGRFLERIKAGAFTKTIRENLANMRVLFNHGADPSIGNKVLGPITALHEDEAGAAYEVQLLDTAYNRELIPGLESDVYGSSFRMRIMRDEWNDDPGNSDHNPEGIPERTIVEAFVPEFGPVTFPAYAGAESGVRSLTDEVDFARLTREPERLTQLIEYVREAPVDVPGSLPEPVQPDTTTERTDDAGHVPPHRVETTGTEGEPMGDIDRFTSVETLVARRDEIVSRQTFLNQEFTGRAYTDEAQAEWDDLKAERDAIDARVDHLKEREAYLADQVERGSGEPAQSPAPKPNAPNVVKPPENLWNLAEYRGRARSAEDERRLIHDGAMRAIELAAFPGSDNREDAQNHVARLMDRAEGRDGEESSGQSTVARMILATGSELYKRAFGKYIASAPMTPEETMALHGGTERALSLTGASGGFAVPFELDPTILGTSNGTVNPLRAISRVIPITVDEWRGVSSAGVTAAYAAEATETTDNAPTLVQPTISTEKAQAFIPFSIEVGGDWAGLQGEMARLLGEAKDDLEANKFTVGTGTNEPFGVITGTTNTVNATAAGVFSLANLYSLFGALPPRYRPRASFLANLAILNSTRQFDTQGGAALWVQLGAGTPDRLLGQPVYENSEMSAVTTVGAKFLLYGDFSRFVIVERVGLTVELIQHLVGTNHRPTGQRGLYAYWRNGAKVVDANAFRTLLGLA